MGVPSAQRQADILKEKGNVYFKKQKLGAAIEAYTEAITLCPRVPVYWTNRALCERKRNEWEKVESDCRKALELDNQSVKAHYMLGLALLHYQQYEEAVKQLEKALDLGRGATPGTYMVEEIWQELSKAKFAGWEASSDVRIRQQVDLKSYLEDLLRSDYDKHLKGAVDSMKDGAALGKGGPASEQNPALGEIDLIDFGQGDDGAEKAIVAVEGITQSKTKFFADVDQLTRVSRVYRTISDPMRPELHDQSLKSTSGSFDPLKQHKNSRSLRRANSLSVRRMRSQTVVPVESVDKDVLASVRASPPDAASPDLTGDDQLKRSELEIGAEKPAQTETGPWDPSNDKPAQAAWPVLKPYDMGAPDLNSGSIFDVFKVFKEFMKFHQHDASKKLLHAIDLYQRRSNLLHHMFEMLAEPDKLTEVPDHLCCKITMDIFRDPVITTSGITYERAAILDHINKVGKFDPVTRIPLRVDQIVPNLAIKEAVQIYLDQHGWAYGPS